MKRSYPIYPRVRLEPLSLIPLNKRKYTRKPIPEFLNILAKEEPLSPEDNEDVKQDFEDQEVSDPYALFSAVAEDEATLVIPENQCESQDHLVQVKIEISSSENESTVKNYTSYATCNKGHVEDEATLVIPENQCEAENQGDPEIHLDQIKIECSSSKTCSNESTPKKKKVKRLKKRRVRRCNACYSESDSDSESPEVRDLKRRLYEVESKMKLKNIKIRNKNAEIRKLREDNLDATSKILSMETSYACLNANYVGRGLDMKNMEDKMKKLEEEKEELQVKLDAEKASVMIYYNNIEDLQQKDEANKNLKIEYQNLQKKERRALRKIEKLDLVNKRLMRRITYCRKINKQSMHWLTELKEISGKSLEPKKLRIVNTLIEDIQKSLELEVEE